MQLLAYLTTLALTGTLAAAARNCPIESDCFQKSCKAITINERIKLGGTWPDVDPTKAVLEAECKDDKGKEWLTWLNLKECIVNWNGNMEWGNHGGFACQLCKLKDRKSGNDPIVMECHCFNDDEKLVKSEINLSFGIWISDGSIGCYQNDGHNSPIGKAPGPPGTVPRPPPPRLPIPSKI